MTTANVGLSSLPISEPLTWEEICARHPDEWVCLVEMQGITDTEFEFSRARVVGHGKSRREPFDQARPWRARYDGLGHFFTGRTHAPSSTRL